MISEWYVLPPPSYKYFKAQYFDRFMKPEQIHEQSVDDVEEPPTSKNMGRIIRLFSTKLFYDFFPEVKW